MYRSLLWCPLEDRLWKIGFTLIYSPNNSYNSCEILLFSKIDWKIIPFEKWFLWIFKIFNSCYFLNFAPPHSQFLRIGHSWHHLEDRRYNRPITLIYSPKNSYMFCEILFFSKIGWKIIPFGERVGEYLEYKIAVIFLISVLPTADFCVQLSRGIISRIDYEIRISTDLFTQQ